MSVVGLTLRTIASGKRMRDKAVIAAHWGTISLFPFGMVARKVGNPLPDRARGLANTSCAARQACSHVLRVQFPFFLGLDPTYDPTLFGLIDALKGGVFVDAGASIDSLPSGQLVVRTESSP